MRSISLNSCPVIGSAAELIRFSQRLSPCQSSSASRFTAGATGSLNLSQSSERPER